VRTVKPVSNLKCEKNPGPAEDEVRSSNRVHTPLERDRTIGTVIMMTRCHAIGRTIRLKIPSEDNVYAYETDR